MVPDPSAEVAELVERMLREDDPQVRYGALQSLLSRQDLAGPVAARLALVLAEPDPEVRRRAASALRELGRRAAAALPALARAMFDASWPVREAAARAIAAAAASDCPIPPPEAERLALLAQREEAGTAFAARGFPKADLPLELLWVVLNDRSPLVRVAAAEALGRIDPGGEALAYLWPVLSHRHARVRCRAVAALVSFRTHAARIVPRLTHLLNDSHREVRRAAALALGQLGSAAGDALELLVRRAYDGEAKVRSAAADAVLALRELFPEAVRIPVERLVKTAGPDAASARDALREVIEWGKLPGSVLRAFAVECLRRLGEEGNRATADAAWDAAQQLAARAAGRGLGAEEREWAWLAGRLAALLRDG